MPLKLFVQEQTVQLAGLEHYILLVFRPAMGLATMEEGEQVLAATLDGNYFTYG